MDSQIAERLDRAYLDAFTKDAWKVLEPGRTFIPNWHIDAICEHLTAVTNGEIRRLIINIPPRHMKSLTASVIWPAWMWIERPETRFLCASYAEVLSIRDNVKTRRLVTSPWYLANWGDRFRLTDDQNQKTRFENNKTGYRIATSVDGVATGEGGDIIIVDDPHNVRDQFSESAIENVMAWWDNSMSTRLSDPKRGAIVVIMQRISERDLVGHLLGKTKEEWEHLCLPAEYEHRHPYAWAGDPRTEEGELLWPARFTKAMIDRVAEDLGTYGRAGQLQQRPSPVEGGMIKRAWWTRYREAPRLWMIVQSWDTAYGKKKGESDKADRAWSVCETWGLADNGVYLLDVYRKKLSFPDLKRAVASEYAAWTPNLVLIENKASGISLIEELKRESGVPILEVEPVQDKFARALANAPFIESGRCHVRENDPKADEFVEEHAMAPNGAWMDIVDAASQAISYLKGQLDMLIASASLGTYAVGRSASAAPDASALSQDELAEMGQDERKPWEVE